MACTLNYLPQILSLMAALSLASCSTTSKTMQSDTNDPWSQVPAILKQIKQPTFRNKDYPITSYGAVADGKTDCLGRNDQPATRAAHLCRSAIASEPISLVDFF